MKLFTAWAVPMFGFGVLRESRSPKYDTIYPDNSGKYPEQQQWVRNSFMNGVYYASPFGLLKLYHLGKRVHERATGFYHDDTIYTELSYNTNLNVLW